MKTEISCLFDNELELHDQRLALDALRGDEELRCAWDRYQLIGDTLRGASGLATNLTPGVMTSLHDEPTVLAPIMRRPTGVLRNLAALAASLTGVAVVGWLALSQPAPQAPLPALAKSAQPAVAGTPESERMQEFLMAHQAYSPSSRIQGGASYIRTIAVSR
ncbi:MAG: sigma-E factor negative regulatory protein [Betaproteobacteria bacterium]|nr:sigma-E factor negative regulatory protein [Betaproteobacteria bacterium]